MHIFAWKLVSRTSKQVSRNLGPLWQPGVYIDTNLCQLHAWTCTSNRDRQVVRTALIDAASVASLMTTTEAIIAEEVLDMPQEESDIQGKKKLINLRKSPGHWSGVLARQTGVYRPVFQGFFLLFTIKRLAEKGRAHTKGVMQPHAS